MAFTLLPILGGQGRDGDFSSARQGGGDDGRRFRTHEPRSPPVNPVLELADWHPAGRETEMGPRIIPATVNGPSKTVRNIAIIRPCPIKAPLTKSRPSIGPGASGQRRGPLIEVHACFALGRESHPFGGTSTAECCEGGGGGSRPTAARPVRSKEGYDARGKALPEGKRNRDARSLRACLRGRSVAHLLLRR